MVIELLLKCWLPSTLQRYKIFLIKVQYNRKRDVYKMQQALNNNHYIIRIPQMDIYSDNNNWQQNLHYILNQIITSTFFPQIIYLTKSDCYDNHKNDMLDYDDIVDEIVLSLQGINILPN